MPSRFDRNLKWPVPTINIIYKSPAHKYKHQTAPPSKAPVMMIGLYLKTKQQSNQ